MSCVLNVDATPFCPQTEIFSVSQQNDASLKAFASAIDSVDRTDTQSSTNKLLDNNLLQTEKQNKDSDLRDPELENSGLVRNIAHIMNASHNLRQLQLNDKKLRPLIDFLETDSLPENDNKLCRKIIFESDFHYLNDDLVLCRERKPFGKNRESIDELCEITEILVLPESVINDVLSAYHDSSHFGITRLSEMVRRRYYFEKLYKKVRDFVRKCPICAKGKTHLPPRANLGETPVASRCSQIYEADIVTGLSTTKKGNKYILTIQCVFSGYIFLYALPDMTSQTIAEKLLLCISQGGVCEMLITDLGANLVGGLMTRLYELLGIKKGQTLSYMPSCLGRAERGHRTLGASLRCLLLQHENLGLEWDDLLPLIELSFRASTNAESHLSAFDLWLGRPVKMPQDVALQSKDDLDASTPEDYVALIRRRLDAMYKIQQEIEAKSRKAMIERYNDTKARPVLFEKGQLVFLNNPAPLDGVPRKIAPLWLGPFEITEKVSDHTVRLQDIVTKKNVLNDVHVDRLKRCFVPKQFFEGGQNDRHSTIVPHSIIDQTGRRFLVRYRDSTNDVDNEEHFVDKWLRLEAVPPSLLTEWRLTHCMNGKPRARVTTNLENTRVEAGAGSSDHSVSEAVEASNSKEDVVHPDSYLVRSDGKAVPLVRTGDVAHPEGLRRSARNTKRVDYAKFDEYGFSHE